MEEIIIDGVKVEECSYYNKDNTPYCCEVWDNECEAQNCYYKQLKRLEEKYNKMVEISKENLIKYEDLRIENQKLIMEIEGLKSQIDFEAQKQAVLLQENEELKEKIIKLTEENGNLIINRNTVENKLRDTESRLISIQKANTHNLVLLQRLNNALEEIREIVSGNYETLDPQAKQEIQNIITKAIGE